MAYNRLAVLLVAVAPSLVLGHAVRADDSLGFQAIRNHDWVTAEKQLRDGLQKNPGSLSHQLSYKLNLAWVYAQTGRREEAVALYEEILRRDQNDLVHSLPWNGRDISLRARRGLALLR